MHRLLDLQRIVVLFVMIFLTLALFEPTSAQTPANAIYLPIISQQPDACTLNSEEAALVDLMRTAPGQGRAAFTCSPILATVAHAQAQDMAARNYCASTDPDGRGPNFRVRQAGYLLPKHYSSVLDGNNIQTVGCGYATAADFWAALSSNPHLLGSDDFWARQTEFGIAYYQGSGSALGYQWVVITAEPGK